MPSTAFKKIEIMKKISQIPDQNLQDIDIFLNGLLKKYKIEAPKPINLKGIWKDKGFEKILDLEAEIKSIRKELSDSILKKF